jgi:hypothetical protein
MMTSLIKYAAIGAGLCLAAAAIGAGGTIGGAVAWWRELR